MQKVENRPHRYKDSFGSGCCERLECGLDRNDAIHQTMKDESIVIFALEEWKGRDQRADVARARELAAQCRREGGLEV